MHPRMEALGASELELVLHLLRAGSLTAAARVLGVEQSTLSRRLAELEARLGTPLFARSRGGLHPTPAAELLRPHAERMEQAVLDARRLALRDQARVAGLVRLAVPEAIADLMVAPNLPTLLGEHPLLCVEILGASSLADLGRLEADVALRFVRAGSGDIVTTKVAESGFAVFGHPRFRRRGPSRPDALPWLTWISRDSPEARWVAERVRKEPVLRTNRVTTMIAAAQAGVGVMLMARVFGAHVKGLEELPMDELPDWKLPVFLASPRAVRDLAAVDTVWRWLARLVGSLGHAEG